MWVRLHVMQPVTAQHELRVRGRRRVHNVHRLGFGVINILYAIAAVAIAGLILVGLFSFIYGLLAVVASHMYLNKSWSQTRVAKVCACAAFVALIGNGLMLVHVLDPKTWAECISNEDCCPEDCLQYGGALQCLNYECQPVYCNTDSDCAELGSFLESGFECMKYEGDGSELDQGGQCTSKACPQDPTLKDLRSCAKYSHRGAPFVESRFCLEGVCKKVTCDMACAGLDDPLNEYVCVYPDEGLGSACVEVYSSDEACSVCRGLQRSVRNESQHDDSRRNSKQRRRGKMTRHFWDLRAAVVSATDGRAHWQQPTGTRRGECDGAFCTLIFVAFIALAGLFYAAYIVALVWSNPNFQRRA